MKSAIAKCLVSAALIASCVVPVIAAPPRHDINWRRHHQQVRIHEGFHNHNLNRRQMGALERREHSIHRAEVRDRRHDHGHLTGRERHNLIRRENHLSHAIYRKKHGQ